MNIAVGGTIPTFPKNSLVAMDIELFKADKTILHRPTTGEFACMSVCSSSDPETVYIIDNVISVPSTITILEDTVWVMHNAKFDVTHLRRWTYIPPRKRIWDTMIIERIMWGGYFDFFALEHLVRRYCNYKLDKSARSKFQDTTELTQEFIKYSATDAYWTLKVCLEQVKQARKEDIRIWQLVDRPAMWAVMDFQGFRLDVDAWTQLAESNKIKADEIEKELSFNPRSHIAVKKELRSKGFKRLPSTGVEVLEKWVGKYPDTDAAKLAQKVIDTRKSMKLYSTYGMNFLNGHLEDDLVHKIKVIHSNFWITGAKTGRMSSSDPNLQNIPTLPEFRNCFIARPDHLIIVADYSAQEPCILAYLCQDKKLISIINSGQDIYIEVAYEVFGERISKKDTRRKQMKALVLGTNYGLTAYGLADREKIPMKDAEVLIKKYLHTFKELSLWMDKQRKRKDFVETVLGRRVWLNKYQSDCERIALNAPVSGSAADMTKLALSTIHRKWEFPFLFSGVTVVHDEIVLDVPKNYAEEVSIFVKDTMKEVAEKMCPGIRFRAEAKIGMSWGVK